MAAPVIALFCNSFPPEGGGASAGMYNMAVLLRDAGYHVQVVCAMPNYPTGKIFPAYRGKKVADEMLDGIAVKRIWLLPSNSANSLGRAVSAISLLASMRLLAYRLIIELRPSLVIVSSPPLPLAWDAVRFFSKHRINVLLNVSDIWPLSATAIGALRGGIIYHILRRMERQMYAHAAAFTAQSEQTRSYIRQIVSDAKPGMVMRNLPAHLPQIAKKSSAKNGPLRIIYPGTLGHAQGMLALCKAISFSKLGAELHIYGEGPEANALAAWIAANPSRGVRQFAPCSVVALNALLPQYEAMLVPLVAPIFGALPSKIFTAAAAGLPVIYSGGGEGERIVREYEIGWCAAPQDYSAIAAIIENRSQDELPVLAARRAHIVQVAQTAFNKAAQDAAFGVFIADLLSSP